MKSALQRYQMTINEEISYCDGDIRPYAGSRRSYERILNENIILCFVTSQLWKVCFPVL